MSIRRFVANKDNTITNAFKSGNSVRGTNANMGASDIVEVFSIYAQASSASLEQSRILIDFPIDDIKKARTDGHILASGSVNFVLKLFNAAHSETTPEDFSISVHPVSSSWDEGTGLDMEEYSDEGASNWNSSSVGSGWTSPGGDYLGNDYVKYVSFSTGLEDLEVDVTDVVEAWINQSLDSHGFLLKLSGAAEDGSTSTSYYTKRFFARKSEFILKRPIIEAQQSSALTDDRANLYKSSSLLPASENLNKIYLYNNHAGSYTDIPSVGDNLFVQLFSSLSDTATAVSVTGGSVSENYISASKFSTGIYEAQFSYAGTESSLYDVWMIKDSGSGTFEQIFSGSSMSVNVHKPASFSQVSDYVISIIGLKQSYNSDEVEHFRVHTRKKNKTPNVYTKATGTTPISIVPNMFYRVVRVSDDYEVIGYSTESAVPYSKLSYDVSGSFFNFDMSILQPNYLYEISFLIQEGTTYTEQKEKFRFRVKS